MQPDTAEPGYLFDFCTHFSFLFTLFKLNFSVEKVAVFVIAAESGLPRIVTTSNILRKVSCFQVAVRPVWILNTYLPHGFTEQ